MDRIITRKDEELFLKLKIADNQIFSKPFSFEGLVKSIEERKLILELSDEDGTRIIDINTVSKIEKNLKYLRKIVSKPKSFIKSFEEKVSVERAKKINYKAIAMLGQDNNDWYQRTLTTVKPKKILSNTNEETIDLYENRFVLTLIEKVSRLMYAVRISYQDQIRNLNDNSTISYINKVYHYNTKSFKLFNKISKKIYNDDLNNNYKNKIEEELKRIKHIEKNVNQLKQSVFYKFLYKKRRVSDPIQRTNVLLFDFNYRQAYILWEDLKNNVKDEKIGSDIEFTEGELEFNYYLYCLSCVLGAVHDLGFVETTKNKLFVDKVRSSINSENLKFKKDDRNLELELTNGSFNFTLNTEKSIKSSFFSFHPIFKDIGAMSRNDVEDYTESILNNLTKNAKQGSQESKYALVSINMNRQSEDTNYPTKVYRRFYGMGDNFSPDENIKDLANWGSYKAGLVIVSPFQLRSNFLKIEKIINYQLFREISFKNRINFCPLCNDRNFKMIDSLNYSCSNCNHRISITYCNTCDSNHKKPILWIKYVNDKFLDNKEIIKEFSELKVHEKINKLEIIMGEKTTTSFELEQYNNYSKLKTICPYCGVKLGE